MSILDTIKDKLHVEGHQGQTVKMISQLITDSGGLNGLVEKFNAAGLGDKINSWISPGAKLPITSDEIQMAIGPTELQSLATKFGLDSNKVSSDLASDLPKWVDKLSPDGKMPDKDELKNKLKNLLH